MTLVIGVAIAASPVLPTNGTSTIGISEDDQEALKDRDAFGVGIINDFGPLLSLFGERFTQQYLSFSTSWLDSVIFAMEPLGVITAITGKPRCGLLPICPYLQS